MRIPQARRRTATTTPQFQQSLHPLLQQILAARGVCHDEQLQLPLANLLPPDSLKGMAAAVGLLQQALHTNLRLLIVADYDADGALDLFVGSRALPLRYPLPASSGDRKSTRLNSSHRL
mgnify:CR=1 FL=1